MSSTDKKIFQTLCLFLIIILLNSDTETANPLVAGYEDDLSSAEEAIPPVQPKLAENPLCKQKHKRESLSNAEVNSEKSRQTVKHIRKQQEIAADSTESFSWLRRGDAGEQREFISDSPEDTNWIVRRDTGEQREFTSDSSDTTWIRRGDTSELQEIASHPSDTNWLRRGDMDEQQEINSDSSDDTNCVVRRNIGEQQEFASDSSDATWIRRDPKWRQSPEGGEDVNSNSTAKDRLNLGMECTRVYLLNSEKKMQERVWVNSNVFRCTASFAILFLNLDINLL